MISRFFHRIRFSRHVDLQGPGSWFFLGPSVRCRLGKNSKIVIKDGQARIGFPLPGTMEYASKPRCVIDLGENAELRFLGDVFIAPGVTIRVKDNAILSFGGQNLIGHDSLLLCGRQMTLGKRTCLSWNVTLIDEDGHHFYRPDGKKLRRFYRPLVVEDNVGIQMNVVIPTGVKVGQNAIISANTVLREDVPSNCLVYSPTDLRLKHGITTGFQHNAQ